MKSGIKIIIIGGALTILGAFIIPVLAIIPLLLADRNEVQFKAPGTIQVPVDKPGRYYLWNEYQTIYKGRSYNRSERIPDGMEIRIKDSSGQLLEFVSNGSMSSQIGSNFKQSVGYVEVKNTGIVDIEVSGGNQEMIFSFSRSGMFKIIVIAFGGFALSGIVALTGFGVIIWGIVKLLQANKSAGSNNQMPAPQV